MIPDYQSLMLPLLKLVSDGQEHKYRDLIETLATEFKVTDKERKELLASGNPERVNEFETLTSIN